ncbi:MAG: potassium-transporting ATPase subunit KdpC [Tumebacillaceae bacterium]
MKSLFTAVRASVLLMLVCGLLYPLVTTGIAQVLFPHQAEGSLVSDGNKVIGSALIAQDFTSPKMFHPRASAAKYNPTASAATNAAVASPDYVKGIADKVADVKKDNPSLTDIPADLVTTSGSGFDPDLSPEAAKAQVPRIAKANGMSETQLDQLIDVHTKSRALGVFGEPRVNVLELNRALLGL